MLRFIEMVGSSPLGYSEAVSAAVESLIAKGERCISSRWWRSEVR